MLELRSGLLLNRSQCVVIVAAPALLVVEVLLVAYPVMPAWLRLFNITRSPAHIRMSGKIKLPHQILNIRARLMMVALPVLGVHQ
ncbi:hypothetical protein D3C86_1794720 [compost metagenome]